MNQHLTDSVVKEFIQHDDRTNNVHLFLRSAHRAPYTYLEQLGYLTHDSTREKPVYFQWQLLDWPVPQDTVNHLGISLVGGTPGPGQSLPKGTLQILKVPAPPVDRGGVSTGSSRHVKSPDHAAQDAKNRALGLQGELLVLQHERDKLIQGGRADLADKVIHTSLVEGDGAGYDILSYELHGEPRLIEVKTTRGGPGTSFFISPNELSCSQKNPEHYRLYRLHGYDEGCDSASSYVLQGDLNKQLRLLPTAFRATLLG